MPAKLIYANSNNCADLLYATGFFACDPFIYFAADRKKGIIVSALEKSRAINEVKSGIKVYEISDIMGEKKTIPQVKDILLKLEELFPYNEWQVPANFPFAMGKFMQEKNIDIKCIESHFFPSREAKTVQEINSLDNALKVAEKAMKKAADIIADSKIDDKGTLEYEGTTLTSEFVKNEIGIEIIKGGGIADHTIVACGKHSSGPHNSGSGALYANKPIVIDIFPRIMEPLNKQLLSGYWGDITRTFLKGKAPKLIKNAYRAVTWARDGSENMIKEGVLPSDVHKFAQKVLNDCGFETGKTKGLNHGFFHGLGHGVGLEVHEAPSVSLRNSQPFKTGNVVTVEPGLYYPEWGGIRLENMVVVQKDNCRILTKFPDFLEIA